MLFTRTRLDGAYVIDIEPREDARGFFARTFCVHEFEAHGLKGVVAQCSIAYSSTRGTLRGMHFQSAPAAETKLVRCTGGAIHDVIVDMRPGSTTYLQHFTVDLSDENRRSLYVPEGFAHGYQTLTDDSEVTYQAGDFYAPGFEGGFRYDDPAFGIQWPLPVTVISDRDAAWPFLDESDRALRAGTSEVQS
ncbi:MAG: dTDP-4-dehydrorhamnose 3,5-epimerase [Gemmatimonadaceae bacterium]